MTSVYYKYAIAAVIGMLFKNQHSYLFKLILFLLVFDLSRPATFDAVLKVKNL